LFNLKAKIYRKKGCKLVIKAVLMKVLVFFNGVARKIEPLIKGAIRFIVEFLKVFI
jgi:hypothetical protein